ncbi:MAG: 16S rRNA (guanine(966)-N(2))-methyltransferase RsmD [Alphaproteobacteria bacterium]|nr:16S rRNA (guanine(966)-N(2))-methyltransferase RsmD [Alphaproteobacteria bacterium]
MRIVAGKHRGRRLKTPESRDVRPTSARAREAIFDVLAHGRFERRDPPLLKEARVIDLFAGSGAMGFEALSRGAAFVTFVETDPAALSLLRENVAVLGEKARVRLVPRDATRIGRADQAVRLAFIDPPYGRDLCVSALAALHEGSWLEAQAVVVVELGAKEELLPPAGFHVFDERRYGAAKVVFLLYGEAP